MTRPLTANAGDILMLTLLLAMGVVVIVEIPRAEP